MPSICGKRCAAPTSLAFDGTAGSDKVFRALVLARIIEPTSKLDSLRVVEETGVSAPSYAKNVPSQEVFPVGDALDDPTRTADSTGESNRGCIST